LRTTEQLRAGVLPGDTKIQVTGLGIATEEIALHTTLDLGDIIGDGTPDFLRLHDPADRSTFRRWFTFLAEAQYFRGRALPAEIDDCAALSGPAQERVQVVPDKKTYQPGETAHVLIVTSKDPTSGIHACNAQILAVRGVAEIESFQGMAAAKVHHVGTGGHCHGLKRLVGLEVSCFPGEHARYVFLHGYERGDEELTVAGANLNREIDAQRWITTGVHLTDATYAKLGGGLSFELNPRTRGAHNGGGDSSRFAGCTGSRLCPAGIGANSQLARGMQVPESHPHNPRKSIMSGVFGSVTTVHLSIARSP
jgi:hypothetical protein